MPSTMQQITIRYLFLWHIDLSLKWLATGTYKQRAKYIQTKKKTRNKHKLSGRWQLVGKRRLVWCRNESHATKWEHCFPMFFGWCRESRVKSHAWEHGAHHFPCDAYSINETRMNDCQFSQQKSLLLECGCKRGLRNILTWHLDLSYHSDSAFHAIFFSIQQPLCE